MSGLVNVSDVVNDPQFSQTFSVKRFTGNFANEGEYDRGSVVTLTRYGSIQPANQDDLNLLPEGQRDGKYIKVYTVQEIRKGDGTVESDQILWDGREYRVTFTKLYKDYGYYFVIAEESNQ
jgi:hypothetical protein